jgi:predicted transcriptional regulator
MGVGAAMDQRGELVERTAAIVAAYVRCNSVATADLPQLIIAVHTALSGLGQRVATAQETELTPAVSIKKSVTPDYIICLEDGKKFKSLRRHLRTSYGLSPEEYRAKWGLPSDYPMVAPNYARERSDLAKKMGLGTRARADD